ncbi:peptidylprolyl isomerase [Candidatus Omnitrophota bacterium]
MLNRLLISLLLVFSLATFSGCDSEKLSSLMNFGQPETPKPAAQQTSVKYQGTALASVDGRIIGLEEFTQRVEAYNKEIKASTEIPDSVKSNYLIETADDKEELLERMVEKELLVAEAITRGLDRDQDLLKALEDLKEQFLFAKLVEAERAKAKVSAKEVENYYSVYKDVFKIAEERKISMMVLSSEQKAKEIMIQLLQGADFAALTRTDSIDRKSAAAGGDIGFIVQKSPLTSPESKTMFEKFEQVAFALELNQASNIFKGPDGYYIIKVTEIKAARQKALSEVKSDIEKGLLLRKQEEALETLIGNLRKNSNVIIYDRLLKE